MITNLLRAIVAIALPAFLAAIASTTKILGDSQLAHLVQQFGEEHKQALLQIRDGSAIALGVSLGIATLRDAKQVALRAAAALGITSALAGMSRMIFGAGSAMDPFAWLTKVLGG